PIIEKGKPTTPRGLRTITHARQPATAVTIPQMPQIPQPNITQALDLLAGLNLGTTPIPVNPTEAFDLLASLPQTTVPQGTGIIPPTVVSPPQPVHNIQPP